tara:strand:- start:6355 stop:7809 length:1455 start_codon:yes stop_codon:yes gene_type:complete
MSRQALENFLNAFVNKLENEMPELARSDYNLQPHTFIFTPGRLGTQTIRSAKQSAKDGWVLTNADMAEIRKLAETHGATLVTKIKGLGGESYSTKGVKLRFITSTDQEVITPEWAQYRLKPAVAAKIFNQQNIYEKVRSSYSETITTFFQAVQDYFAAQESYTSSKTNRKRTRGIRGGKDGGGALVKGDSTSLQAGHLHGAGILETQLRQMFNSTYDSVTKEMQQAGIKDAQELYRILESLGLDLSVVRADDGEGFIIMLEDRSGNIAAGGKSKKAKQEFMATAKGFISNYGDLGDLEGSDSIVRRNRKLIIKQVAKEFRKAPNVKVRTEDTKLKTSKGGAKKTIGSPKVKKASMVSLAASAKMPTSKRKAKRRPPPPKMALVNILGMLNIQLPKTIARNMGDPRLNNRTGRFAQSVRATDASVTAEGFPSIGYTYMRERYGGYESTSGTRFADIDRDPRRLIDQSIREIVIAFGIGRVYTRRQ